MPTYAGISDQDEFWQLVENTLMAHNYHQPSGTCSCGWDDLDLFMHIRQEMIKATAPLWRIVQTND